MKRGLAKVIPVIATERHSIRCPKCYVPMSLTTVDGVSVEKCPTCEGTFFDKGEMETLIRRNVRLRRFNRFRLFRWN